MKTKAALQAELDSANEALQQSHEDNDRLKTGYDLAHQDKVRVLATNRALEHRNRVLETDVVVLEARVAAEAEQADDLAALLKASIEQTDFAINGLHQIVHYGGGDLAPIRNLAAWTIVGIKPSFEEQLFGKKDR